MMREILPGIGNLGQLFWTSDHPPSQYAAAAAAHNVTTLKLMDSETRNDLAVLSSKMESVPCAPVGSETLKCEACAGGCQKYADISTKLDISNERTHYVHPTTKADLLLYRSHSHALFASVREAGSDKWSKPLLVSVSMRERTEEEGELACCFFKKIVYYGNGLPFFFFFLFFALTLSAGHHNGGLLNMTCRDHEHARTRATRLLFLTTTRTSTLACCQMVQAFI